MTVHTLAELALTLAGTVHGGTLAVFALLLVGRSAVPSVAEADLVRCFRATGATLGLSLGLFILAGAWRYAHAVNPGAGFPDAFAVPIDDPLTIARLVVFGAYWVSYVWLEIFTLEPTRMLDGGLLGDVSRWKPASAAVARHVSINAVLFLTNLLLGTLGAAP